MIAAALVVGLALIVGDAARHALHVRAPSAERIAVAGGLGLAILSLCAFALAAAGLFRPLPLLLVGATLALVSVVARDREPPPVGRPSRAEAGVIAAILMAIVASLPFLAAPEVAYDAVYYHLPVARDIASAGALVFEPDFVFTAFPLGAELLYAIGAVFGALEGARSIHFATGVLALLASYALGRRLHSKRAGFVAALAWCVTPLIVGEMLIAYVDLFPALFAALASLCALRWLDGHRTRDAALAGVFLGAGFAVKLTMAVAAIPLLVALALVGARSRRDALHLGVTAAAATLVAAPHYLRAAIVTGNPVFPYFNGMFGSRYWEPVNDTFDHLHFGVGRSPLDFALLPVSLIFSPDRFDQSFLPYLSGLPLAVAAACVFSLATGGRVRVIALVVLFGTAAWFAYAQYARYLIPIFPAGAALVGRSVAPLLEERRLLPRLAAKTGVVAAALFGGALMVIMFFSTAPELSWEAGGPPPLRYSLALESRDAYLERNLRHYAMYRWLAANFTADGPVLGVHFSEAPLLYSPLPISRAEMTLAGRRVLAAPNAEQAMAALRSAGFRYVLFDRAPYPSDWTGPHLAATSEFVERNLRFIHAEGVLALYAVPP